MSADTPALSVILIATHDYALIRDAVRNLARQRDVPIELVIAGPLALDESISADDRADLATFAHWQHVVVPDGTRFDDARAAGVRAADAPIVAFAEDHSDGHPDGAGLEPGRSDRECHSSGRLFGRIPERHRARPASLPAG